MRAFIKELRARIHARGDHAQLVKTNKLLSDVNILQGSVNSLTVKVDAILQRLNIPAPNTAHAVSSVPQPVVQVATMQ